MKYDIELPAATLNSDGITTSAGWLTIYNIEPEQREFISATSEFLPEGIGLPAMSFADKPELPADGHALVRSADGQRWETPPDYRGETAYHTETGEPEAVLLIGELPETLTFTAPATAYDRWDGAKWVTDTEAQHADLVAQADAEKQERLSEAQAIISGWQTELQLGIISDDDKSRLTAWMEYIKKVQAVDTSDPEHIVWPKSPEAS